MVVATRFELATPTMSSQYVGRFLHKHVVEMIEYLPINTQLVSRKLTVSIDWEHQLTFYVMETIGYVFGMPSA